MGLPVLPPRRGYVEQRAAQLAGPFCAQGLEPALFRVRDELQGEPDGGTSRGCPGSPERPAPASTWASCWLADVAEAAVRRGHAASMALFAGLQAVATQRLAEPDSEELRSFVAGRVEMARFVLDLLSSTE
jgi:hypothetical protein